MTGNGGESLDSLELDLQTRLADYFIDQVSGYVDRVTISQFTTEGAKRNVAGLSGFIQLYREQSDTRQRLLAAEDLCDRIVELVMTEQLDSRSAPADALLEYREPFPDQQNRCSSCNKRPKARYLGSKQTCVRCYFEEE
jgi:hypothetical protein